MSFSLNTLGRALYICPDTGMRQSSRGVFLMSFLLAGPSITELAREKVVIDLFRMKTFSQCWEIWQPEISRYLPEDPSPETVLSLGGKLRDVFKTTKPANRDQKAISGGGAIWEALVCYYLNLCLIGSNAVVFKKTPTSHHEFVSYNISILFHLNYDISYILSNHPYYNIP